MKNFSLLLLFCLALIACDSKDESLPIEFQPRLQGTWLLTERGFSPGSGYIIEPVAPNPAQTITFSGEKGFSSSVQGMAHFNYYAIVTDTTEVSTLQLYVEDPASGTDNPPAFNKYYIELKDDSLKIMMIGCIEGCHLGFRKTGSAWD